MRSALLRQLLLWDWDCRRRAGDEPNAGDYHTRFPGDMALIEDVCREMTKTPVSTRVEPNGPHVLDTPWSGAGEVGRIDNPYGDRNLICSCPPIEQYAGIRD